MESKDFISLRSTADFRFYLLISKQSREDFLKLFSCLQAQETWFSINYFKFQKITKALKLPEMNWDENSHWGWSCDSLNRSLYTSHCRRQKTWRSPLTWRQCWNSAPYSYWEYMIETTWWKLNIHVWLLCSDTAGKPLPVDMVCICVYVFLSHHNVFLVYTI